MKKNKNYLGRNFSKTRTPDKITKKARYSLMSKIRSRDTGLEKNFIAILKEYISQKFDIYRTDIRGKPDIVFEKRKVCVFVDSDFWHGWHFSRWEHLLKNDFWRSKIRKNRIRDKRVSTYLRRRGWSVIRVWEHQIKKDPIKCLENIKRKLKRSP